MEILIVGATSAIGENLSQELSKRNHKIYGVGRKQDILKEMVNKGYLKDYLVADIITKGGRKDIVEYSMKNFIDCLIYSHGKLDDKHLEESNENDVEEIMQTNLTSIILTDLEFSKKIYNPEKIFYLASVSSLYSWGGGVVYQASKSGLTGYVPTMRLLDKLAGRQTERIMIYPDTIATERGMSSQLKDFPKIPMKPFVEEVANVVEGKYQGEDFLFLIKDDETIFLEKLITNKETNRPIFYRSRKIKKLGKAVK